MSDNEATGSVNTTLRKNALGVGEIVFLVVAAVAPLTGMIVVAGLAIALGNGGGAAFSFLAVAVILLLFAIGYGKMSNQLVNAGGFYAFVVKGLGRPAGLAAGFIAMLGYNFFVVGTIATSGFFMMIVIEAETGFHLPWIVWGLLSIAACYLFALRGIDFSSRLLGIALVLEVAILVVFDIAVLFKTGYSLSAFSFTAITSGSLAIGLLLAATGFLGFEATSLFSEEAKDPPRTVPRATYVAITFIGIVLGVSTWAVVSATGVAKAQDTALAHLDSGDLIFSLAEQYIGGTLTTVMHWLLLVSLTAAMLAFHNSASRYIFALGRARILPTGLSKTRTQRHAPYVACTVQAGFAALVAIGFALAKADPIGAVVPSMLGFGTLAILVLQAMAALSIVVHFRRTKDPRIGSTLIAPGLGFVGLCFIVVLAVVHFDVIASSATVVRLLPLLLVLALIGGIGYAVYLHRTRPEVYAGLSSDLERFDQTHPWDTDLHLGVSDS